MVEMHIANQSKSEMIINANHNKVFERAERSQDAGNALGQEGTRLFNIGSYAYSAKFLKAAIENDSYGQLFVAYRVFYQADLLAANPTPEGWKEFHDDMESMLKEIETAIETHQTGSDSRQKFYNKKAVLQTVVNQLNLVAALLPDSSEEQKYIGGVSDKVKQLKKRAESP